MGPVVEEEEEPAEEIVEEMKQEVDEPEAEVAEEQQVEEVLVCPQGSCPLHLQGLGGHPGRGVPLRPRLEPRTSGRCKFCPYSITHAKHRCIQFCP